VTIKLGRESIRGKDNPGKELASAQAGEISNLLALLQVFFEAQTLPLRSVF
jgi:hypothetical protein